MSTNSDPQERFTFQLKAKKLRKLEQIAEKQEVSVAHLLRRGADMVIETQK
jgi:hypothetical protein